MGMVESLGMTAAARLFLDIVLHRRMLITRDILAAPGKEVQFS
jgi:hypothetical protein